jgi:hypothetical protein
MRKIAVALLCLLPLTAAGKELKLDLKYGGTIDSALARADDSPDARRGDLVAATSKETRLSLAKDHAKGGNGRHGFGRLWADVVKSTRGSLRPAQCKR